MKVHYAGEVRYVERGTAKHILPGWAACCSGDRAQKVFAQGNHTWMVHEVTCQPCLRIIAKAGVKHPTVSGDA